MSYEGYEQAICANGYLSSIEDSYYAKQPQCCACGAHFVWRNPVDDTKCKSSHHPTSIFSILAALVCRRKKCKMSTNQIPDLRQYFQDAYKRQKNTGERLGQAMFNHLFEIRPKLANTVRGTDNDPFYVPFCADPFEHRLMTNFRRFISTNWYLPEYIDE